MVEPTEICILAGGLSSRMGRNKALARIAGQTMLRRVFGNAQNTGLPIRIIRRDLVPRCGPLGGLLTALRTATAETILFLSCDMPFVTEELIRLLLSEADHASGSVFTFHQGLAGFPFLIPRAALPRVEHAITRQEFSLQKLAGTLQAVRFEPPEHLRAQLRNINTPDELRAAQ